MKEIKNYRHKMSEFSLTKEEQEGAQLLEDERRRQ